MKTEVAKARMFFATLTEASAGAQTWGIVFSDEKKISKKFRYDNTDGTSPSARDRPCRGPAKHRRRLRKAVQGPSPMKTEVEKARNFFATLTEGFAEVQTWGNVFSGGKF